MLLNIKIWETCIFLYRFNLKFKDWNNLLKLTLVDIWFQLIISTKRWNMYIEKYFRQSYYDFFIYFINVYLDILKSNIHPHKVLIVSSNKCYQVLGFCYKIWRWNLSFNLIHRRCCWYSEIIMSLQSNFGVIMVMWYARLSQYRVLLRISYSKCFISGQRPTRNDFFVAALRDYVRKAEQEERRLATDMV